jgi:hypothetical protein
MLNGSLNATGIVILVRSLPTESLMTYQILGLAFGSFLKGRDSLSGQKVIAYSY